MLKRQIEKHIFSPYDASQKLLLCKIYFFFHHEKPLAWISSHRAGGQGVGSFAPFAQFSPIFPTSQISPKFRHFRHILPWKPFSAKTQRNARKSQNTPSTNPYRNETQFPLSSLKNATSGHARPPKSALCPPVISGTNSRQNSLKNAKFRHGTAGLSNGE